MLLTDLRLRTIYIALAGMDASLLAVYLLLLFRVEWLWQQADSLLFQATPRLLLFGLWVGMLAVLLLLDLLNQSRLEDQGDRWGVVGLALLSILIGVLWLAGPIPFTVDGEHLRQIGAGIVNFHEGIHPALAILLLMLFLWLRASVLSGREINFLGVGMGFRLGLLLMILGGGLLVFYHPEQTPVAIFYFLFYLSFGLLAVSLARSDEKAEAAPGSAGTPLTWGRLGQLLLILGIVVGAAWVVGLLYTPAAMRATLALFQPLWNLLGQIISLLFVVMLLILEQIVAWIYSWLAPLLAGLEFPTILAEALGELQFAPGEGETPPNLPADAASELTLLIIRMLVITVAAGLLIALTLIFLTRRRRRHRQEAEQTAGAPAHVDGSGLRRGWDRLKRWAELVKQYGIGSQLLDALTVEAIYANLTRLARQRGHPRRPATPPDLYLPALMAAFPANEAGLARITEAYMRVHYGDQPVSGEELAQVRADYEAVRKQDDSKQVDSNQDNNEVDEEQAAG